MKKLIFILLVIASICYLGCIKSTPTTPSCTDALPYSDSVQLLTFADDSIKTTFDSTGIFYQILDSGNLLSMPNYYSNCRVTYIGKLMTNDIFDSATNSNLGGDRIYQLIPAWQFALSKIGVGGHIRILTPSTYAYGCSGFNVIPANAPLYFDITLLSIY